MTSGYVLCYLVFASGVGLCDAGQCTLSDANVAPCKAPRASDQRVRREIKDLTESEWKAVVDAMWIMKIFTMAEGKARYGTAFRTFDYFAVKHGVMSLDSRGEQAHFGDYFITVHLALNIEFENSLLAVDPSIEGLPYWEMNRFDAFTPRWFGSSPGTGAGQTVIDGAFAHWRITDNFDISNYAPYMRTIPGATNGFTGYNGRLRGNNPPNPLNTPYLTRYGSVNGWTFTPENQSSCVSKSPCWDEFYTCIDRQDKEVDFHTGIHRMVGGVDKSNSSGLGVLHGDLEDPDTAPNDPAFFFHHNNIDRFVFKWMAAHPDESDAYFGYKGSEKCADRIPWNRNGCAIDGVDLADEMNGLFPFSSQDLGVDQLDTPAMTHAELICHFNPKTSPFRFAEPGEQRASSSASTRTIGFLSALLGFAVMVR